jgi:hypothetical protein
MKNSNWKTTLLGVCTIVVTVASALKVYLAGGGIPDLGIVISSVTAGIGLIAAKDANNRT